MAYDNSGNSVSLSSDGSIVAIGAENNDGNNTSSGHVRIFRLNDDDQWIKIGGDINGQAAYDYSGAQSVFLAMVQQLQLEQQVMIRMEFLVVM